MCDPRVLGDSTGSTIKPLNLTGCPTFSAPSTYETPLKKNISAPEEKE